MTHSLFELEKDFYLGNFQSCISKANLMPSSRETAFYMCLSYLQLKKFDILELELKKSNEKCVHIIKLLQAYKQKTRQTDAIIQELNHMLEDKSADSTDDLSRIVISTIFLHEKMYSEALKSINCCDSLPAMLAQVGIYVQMNRPDYGEKVLKTMQAKDDYSSLTLLAAAQVRLATGNPREAYDIAKELEDLYKPTYVLNNIKTAAAISMGNIDLAKQHCENALDLDNDNLEALINMIHIMSRTRSSSDVKNRYLGRLKDLYPDHAYVTELDRLELELC